MPYGPLPNADHDIAGVTVHLCPSLLQSEIGTIMKRRDVSNQAVDDIRKMFILF
jgi:hypothetical protein